ncbi:MAG: carbohydrate ABC transporter substrate-binding protein [Tabrizicola sp.]|nr:carbohydrate ABC transporter substrate-binding protein [Tabrizicola sp.]
MGVARLLKTTALALLLAQPALAEGKKAEVLHWWTSAGEAAAIKVFADAYNAAGGEWVDNGVGGDDTAKNLLASRIAGGNPPQVGQFNTSREYEEFVAAGLLEPLDAVSGPGNWDGLVPSIFQGLVKRDGHYYAVPVNIHGSNWLWYNMAAFETAGATPPTDWDSFFAAAEKLKAAGIIPLAQGGEAWQERITFYSVMLSVGGRDFYLKFIQDKDEATVRSDKMKEVIAVYTKLRDLVRETDAASPGRSWNEATQMVVTGKAGMQIMGDWAKGEFTAANMEAGKDYGCVPAVTAGGPYQVSGDVFVFPKTGNAADLEAQMLMAQTMIDAKVQVDFNLKKGSVPVRPDVDVAAFDTCSQQALQITANNDLIVGSTDMYATADLTGALQDVYTTYWNSTEMTADELVEKIVEAMKAAG